MIVKCLQSLFGIPQRVWNMYNTYRNIINKYEYNVFVRLLIGYPTSSWPVQPGQ